MKGLGYQRVMSYFFQESFIESASSTYHRYNCAFMILHPDPTAHLWVPLTFSSTAGAVWSGGPGGALFPAVLLPVGVGRWGRLQLGAGTEYLSWATGW